MNAIDVKLQPPWPWVSLVGCCTSVLRSRGVKCDFTDVAGMSGYAFLVNTSVRVGPEGVTSFDWLALQPGLQALGLETEVVFTELGEDPGGPLEEVFERVKAEVDAGRCPVVWAACGSPEFAVVYGYDGDNYLVRSARSVNWKKPERLLKPEQELEDPVPHDRLPASGKLGAVFFGDKVEAVPTRTGVQAVVRAAGLLSGRHAAYWPGFAHGAAAFDAWADALCSGEFEPEGNAYNAACYWELQMFGAGFLSRLARHSAGASKELAAAGLELARSWGNLEQVKDMFAAGASPGRDGVEKAEGMLRDCGQANRAALAALENALALL